MMRRDARGVQVADRVLPPGAEQEEVCAFFGLDSQACARLDLYVQQLRRWNARINLVARSTLEEVWVRHVADGLQLLKHLPGHTRQVIDLGSGGGVPGLVMALAAPQRAQYHLVEANHRKCAFLRQVAQQAGVVVHILPQRIEALDVEALAVDNHTVITARALASLHELLDMAAPLIHKGAEALLLKGRGWQRELAQAQRHGKFDSQVYSSVTDPQGVILHVREVENA